MCGPARLSSDVSEIKLVFSIPPDRPTPNIAPSWNVAPTDPLPVVGDDTRAGERSLDVMRWGLVPFWAKDMKVGFANINAKTEGIEGKSAFREAFQWRRCLVPVDNFYEWEEDCDGQATPVRDFESARRPRSLGKPSRFRPTVRSASEIIFLLILVIAADSRTVHSEYVGKTTGPETKFAANRLVGHPPWGQKDQIIQVIIF